ncbi:AAA family ATPase, partial [Candidatus Woesearchaeota archaeon]|nr:AAA family ATPase [Candidatus Woesearchaeota archaeon]
SIEAFTPGKIFRANNGILFFDELNRCPEKLQNALLQVLEEGRATIGSYDIDLEAEFLLIGTMNPEDTSTEKLSDVFLDRFDLIYMKHPESQGIELQIVKTKGKNIAPYPESLLNFMVSFMRGLRSHQKLEKVPSVRASIGLYDRSQAMAKIRRHEKVAYQDLNDVVVSVLSHRIRLKPSFKYLMSNDDFVQQEFSKFSKGAQEDGDVP